MVLNQNHKESNFFEIPLDLYNKRPSDISLGIDKAKIFLMRQYTDSRGQLTVGEYEKELPFKDQEFDFVIASHVIEHVKDFEFFINELERISSKGYIELPSRLGDNLVFENKTDHIWWFVYDDINNKLLASKRNQLVEPFLTVSTAKLFEKIFRESLVIELIWDKKIEYQIDNSLQENINEEISFFKLFKKYLSKKFRSFYR